MKYYDEILDSDSNYIYSCDMVRFSIELRKDCCEWFSHRFSSDTRLDVKIYPVDFRPFKYRQLLNIDVGDSTVSIGVGFNGFEGNDERLKGFIEFNPNKCFPEWRAEFLDIVGRCSKVEVSRMDVAIDIPIERLGCSLVKDGRLYEYHQKAPDDITEYLGRRNSPGRVKLYNKAKEQGLLLPMTRLEITTECDMVEFKKHIPEVILSDVQQIDFEHANLSDLTRNERVYVSLLNRLPLSERLEFMKKFTYRLRKKLQKYVMAENRLAVNLSCVRQVFRNIEVYCNLF